MIKILMIMEELKEFKPTLYDVVNEILIFNNDIEDRRLTKIKLNIPELKFISIYNNMEKVIINFIRYRKSLQQKNEHFQYYYHLYINDILSLKRDINLERIEINKIQAYNDFKENLSLQIIENDLFPFESNPNLEYNYKDNT